MQSAFLHTITGIRALSAALALALISAAPSALCGQAASGLVIDATTGAGVADASIEALDESGQQRAQAVTDSAGHFALPLPAGRYRFRVTHLGYETIETESLQFNRGETVTLEIRLGARPIRMDPLVVRSRQRITIGSEAFYARMERQRALGQGDFITRADIEETTTSDINALIARHPQVRTGHGGPGGFTEMLVLEQRGGGQCLPAIWVDGMRIMRNDQTDLRSWFHPDNVEGVEIYPNAAFAPPELVAGSACGAIAIWSRQQRGNPFTLKRIVIGAIIAITGFAMTQ